MEKIEVNDKYEIIVDLENNTFKCLRYGEEWRDLVGDNLILSLCQKIQDLEHKINCLT